MIFSRFNSFLLLKGQSSFSSFHLQVKTELVFGKNKNNNIFQRNQKAIINLENAT